MDIYFKIKISIILIMIIFSHNIAFSQGDINLKLSESSINQTLQALVDSKAINFASYDGSYGLSNYNVNITGASANLVEGQSTYNVILYLDLTARATFNLVLFHFDVTTTASLSIRGMISSIQQDQGFKLIIDPVEIGNFSSTGTFLDDIVEDELDGFITQLPEITLASYTSLLPNIIAQYFTSATPALTVTYNEVVLSLNITSGLRYITAYNDLNQQTNVGNIQDEEGTNNYITYPSPKTFAWNTGTTQKLQTPLALLDASNGTNKYRFWFKGWETIPITEIASRRIQLTVGSQDETYRAEFDLAKHVQLDNLLEGQFNGGTVTYESTTAPAFDDYDYFHSTQTHPINTTVPNSTLGTNWVFQKWSDGNINPSRNIILNSDINLTASYKGTQLSDTTTAYSNNSQRKFLRTTYETTQLNSVYESMNRVWYEASTDGGSTWSIKNNGAPLSSAYSSSPSISSYVTPDNAWVLISFAESYDNSPLTSDIRVMRIIPTTSQIVQQMTITDGFSDGLFKNPVIASNANQNTITNFVLVYEVKTQDTYNDWDPGIYYRVAYVPINGFDFMWLDQPQRIDDTNISSYTPTISTNYNNSTNSCEYKIAWEQKTTSSSSNILSRSLYVSGLQSLTATLSPTSTNISYGCGFTQNSNPSLITVNNNIVKAVWLGGRQVTADETPTGPQSINALTNWEYKTVYKDLTTGTKKIYGTRTNLPTINKLDNNSEFFFAYSEQSDLAGKVVLGSDIRTICQLDAYGKDVQIGNGSTINSVKANLFKSTTLPFYFSLSTDMEHVTPKKNNLAILSGREGIVFKDSAQFYFAVGDVLVDNIPVTFKSFSDTLNINTISQVNEFLETEPFTLLDNSVFYYSVQYGVTDPIAASQVLTGSQNINFRVELIEASSGAIIGSFDNIFYSRDSVYLYNNIAYQVNTAGIGNTQVKLRLVINSSGDFDYSLTERFAEGSVLGKMAFKQINLDGSALVKEYALAQNFPNPFNPNTTIRYQIPQDGIITLKIYDILGSEVATLVNEEKIAGKYEVNFNASLLASGVYIYKIQAGSFINSKKMILIK